MPNRLSYPVAHPGGRTLAALAWCCLQALAGSEDLAQRFAEQVRPFLETHCIACHAPAKRKGGLDLTTQRDLAAVDRDSATWQLVRDVLTAGEMPPKDAIPQPAPTQRAAVLAWISDQRRALALSRAGDPGSLPPRRLTNAEFDNSVRDLTGVDIAPTSTFPADPIGEAGFPNTAASLGISPGLLEKYAQAARAIAEHAYLTTTGIAFAPTPLISDAAAEPILLDRIIAFYARYQRLSIAAHLAAAWLRGHPEVTDAELGRLANGTQPRYVEHLSQALSADPGTSAEMMARLRRSFRAVKPADLRTWAKDWEDRINARRSDIASARQAAVAKSEGSPQVRGLAKRRAMSDHRNPPARSVISGEQRVVMPIDLAAPGDAVIHVVVGDGGDGPSGDEVRLSGIEVRNGKSRSSSKQTPSLPKAVLLHELLTQVQQSGPVWAADGTITITPNAPLALRLPREALRERGFERCELALVATPTRTGSGLVQLFHQVGGASPKFVDPDLRRPFLSAIENDPVVAALNAEAKDFCACFPFRWYVGEQRKDFQTGVHMGAGYIRDDDGLYAVVLDAQGRTELDRLWLELDLVSNLPARQLIELIQLELKSGTVGPREQEIASNGDLGLTEANLARVRDAFVGGISKSKSADRNNQISAYFADLTARAARTRATTLAAEPVWRRAVEDFAARAWRRPLVKAEAEELQAIYAGLRKEGATATAAMRGCLEVVLTSPRFSFRVETRPPGAGQAPVDARSLANRLSYALWASAPDAALMKRAESGDLIQAAVLRAEVARMLADPRMRGLVEEFLGNWLGIRRFVYHAGVDRTVFPQFTDGLRRSMYEEPIRFVADAITRDASILDWFSARHSFVDRELAKHYGLPEPAADGWNRVEAIPGRGGLLGMAAFLTRNSSGERTSPVKRGFWIVDRILGEHIPAPPPDVPELPAKETELGGRTLRQILAAHREHPSCAGCHRRFDDLGLALEGFGPIGELRRKDRGGQQIDDRVDFPGAGPGQGLGGLRSYLTGARQHQVVEQFCRKLLAYSLGRSLLVSDEPLLDAMRGALAADSYRFSAAIQIIVASPQFRSIRGLEHPEG